MTTIITDMSQHWTQSYALRWHTTKKKRKERKL